MKERDITIKELSCNTGISEPTLKRLRSCDNTNPTLDVLIKLSAALDITLPQLILEEENQKVIIYQDKFVLPDESTEEFIYLFTKETFGFAKGAKAIFRKYRAGSPITKYVVTHRGKLLEKVDEEKLLFRNEKFENIMIKNEIILAYITKELFEVNYV